MKKSNLLIGLLLAVVFSMGGIFDQPVQAKEYKARGKKKILAKVPLAGDADRNILVVQLTAPPKMVGGKHYHPGQVFVYVLEGKLTITTKDREITVSKGELYQEVPNEVMWAKNVSASESTKLLVFQVGAAGKPFMIKAK